MQHSSSSLPGVLTMGFSPQAAVATWRLAESRAVQCFTYWPVESVRFQSEQFGKSNKPEDSVYTPKPFDLANPKAQLATLPQNSLAAVILVVPTIKDVVRMCKRLAPAISKSTIILVDVSGGIAPLQRLVRVNIGSGVQVIGMICDIDAEFGAKQGSEWTVVHRHLGPAAGPLTPPAITLEPSSSQSTKLIATLESAWSAAGLGATHPRTPSAFGELQWQRTIAVVAFELLTVALDIPQSQTLAQSLIAKPIIEGLVGELSMIAAASGIKGMPSRSQLVAKGPQLARRAPSSYRIAGASRAYYDVDRRAPIALDFLVLLPILLSDELPKGGATPYLESLYAYLSRILDLNSGTYESPLFQRIGSSGSRDLHPETAAQLEAQVKDIQLRETTVASRTKELDTRESDLTARESRYTQVLADLQAAQASHGERVSQFEREVAQHARSAQSLDELNTKAEQLRYREEALADVERRAAQRERELRQRELNLSSRESAAAAIPSAGSGMPNGMSNGMANGMANGVVSGMANGAASSPPHGPSNGTMTSGVPSDLPVPGTPISRFDPRSQQQFYGVQATSTQSISGAPGQYDTMRRQRPPNAVPQQGGSSYGRSLATSPSTMQMPFSASQPYGFNGPPPQQQAGPPRSSRRQSRRASLANEDIDMMSKTGNNTRRRQQSMPTNSYPASPPPPNTFSQNFQLDSVLGSATDRYHFVSRAQKKQRDVKLSSDENAYQQNRKFLHGGPTAFAYSQGINQSAPPTLDRSSASIAGDVASRGGPYLNAGDVSVGSAASQLSPRRQSQQAKRAFIPDSVVTPATSVGPAVDFGGFTFGEPMDPGHSTTAHSSGSTGSNNNLSSSGSNATPTRSRSGTPPTPQGSMDPAFVAHQKWAPTVGLNFS